MAATSTDDPTPTIDPIAKDLLATRDGGLISGFPKFRFEAGSADSASRRAKELQVVRAIDARCHSPGIHWAFISVPWLQAWLEYAGGTGMVPGPIDNSPLLVRTFRPWDINPDAKIRRDYRAIRREAWDYLHTIYGGGPLILRRSFFLDAFCEDSCVVCQCKDQLPPLLLQSASLDDLEREFELERIHMQRMGAATAEAAAAAAAKAESARQADTAAVGGGGGDGAAANTTSAALKGVATTAGRQVVGGIAGAGKGMGKAVTGAGHWLGKRVEVAGRGTSKHRAEAEAKLGSPAGPGAWGGGRLLGTGARALKGLAVDPLAAETTALMRGRGGRGGSGSGSGSGSGGIDLPAAAMWPTTPSRFQKQRVSQVVKSFDAEGEMARRAVDSREGTLSIDDLITGGHHDPRSSSSSKNIAAVGELDASRGGGPAALARAPAGTDDESKRTSLPGSSQNKEKKHHHHHHHHHNYRLDPNDGSCGAGGGSGRGGVSSPFSGAGGGGGGRGGAGGGGGGGGGGSARRKKRRGPPWASAGGAQVLYEGWLLKTRFGSSKIDPWKARYFVIFSPRRRSGAGGYGIATAATAAAAAAAAAAPPAAGAPASSLVVPLLTAPTLRPIEEDKELAYFESQAAYRGGAEPVRAFALRHGAVMIDVLGMPPEAIHFTASDYMLRLRFAQGGKELLM